MSSVKWQEQAEELKQELTREINKREKILERTIPSHICINNLKSKLNRLEEIEKILSIEKYKLVFIGTIGEGKTTAICHLFNLIGNFTVSKTIVGKTRNVTEVQELLATGSGRTTICEVIIQTALKTYIEIEPYSHKQMEDMIVDFCESFANGQGEEKAMISKEIETAIRNVIDLKKISKTVTGSNKKQTQRIDKAQEEFKKSGIDGLKDIALRNANLESRILKKVECEPDEDERSWLKRTFALLNSVELKEFAIPEKIYIYVSDKILSESNLLQFQAVVDTKGIDENPIRKDLQEYIESQDVICLFSTNFKDAPETNIRELMKYYLSSKSRDFHHRFVTFVITHKTEPEKVNDGDGTWELGTDIKREDIQNAFQNLNLEFFPNNIIFYDALRYYDSEITKLKELFTKEDVQQDRSSCIQAVNSVIEHRKKILQDEIEAITNSFQKIREGETLTKEEIEVIKDAIQKIKDMRDLGNRIPSFVYDDFIDNFISYYHAQHRAWNTKHAFHRYQGFFNNMSIYYDARVVAEGTSKDKMLKKFTKDVKKDLEGILDNLRITNKALETFIPELIIQLDTFYDDFIEEVGRNVEKFLKEKLKGNPDFWMALVSEKGRKDRDKGETYTDNVLQTFRYELELDPNLNSFLKEETGKYWASLISKVLKFFGEV
ncbi:MULTISPECIES: hypothetical protein [Spirulina sp. CCY15215]|uniref:hypothetical protein n=1 Tax=Spirulina sp. CCY15215 TaxID=2767591 RepID=UPI0019524466|nr:hypothetical protein [Spirulina major]